MSKFVGLKQDAMNFINFSLGKFLQASVDLKEGILEFNSFLIQQGFYKEIEASCALLYTYLRTYISKVSLLYEPLIDTFNFLQRNDHDSFITAVIVPLQLIILGCLTIPVGLVMLTTGVSMVAAFVWLVVLTANLLKNFVQLLAFLTSKILLFIFYPLKFTFPNVYKSASRRSDYLCPNIVFEEKKGST